MQCLLGRPQLPRRMARLITLCINCWQLLNGWFVSSSQTTIYRIFCMCPTRKSLAVSESLTQTRKCCWFRETLAHPVIDTPHILMLFTPGPLPRFVTRHKNSISSLFRLRAVTKRPSLWGWDWHLNIWLCIGCCLPPGWGGRVGCEGAWLMPAPG